MIIQTQIDQLKEIEGVDWITAMKTEGIKKLVSGEAIQMELFDKRTYAPGCTRGPSHDRARGEKSLLTAFFPPTPM